MRILIFLSVFLLSNAFSEDELLDINYSFISKYEKVIIISTELKFEDLNIHAELFILTSDNSILYIKEKLNKILDEL